MLRDIKAKTILFLGIILLASLGYNVYQYYEKDKTNKWQQSVIENDMRNYEVVFSNAFYDTNTDSIDNNINISSTEELSGVIESIQDAVSYWRAASSLLDNGDISTDLLIQGYLQELKGYRSALSNKEEITTDDENLVKGALNDLTTIAEWLYSRYKDNNFSFYTQKDFGNEVLDKLNSEIKNNYINFFNTAA